MIFLGARGTTSWQMNELLRFDEMISFNPHLLYKNVAEALSNIESAACVKQLFVDKTEDAVIEFYKARVAYFYGGNVDVADFGDIDEVIRRETNRRVSMKSGNSVADFMHHDHPKPQGPMALYAANYFKSWSSPRFSEFSEMNFINLPRGRRLVPVPAASLRANLRVCYHPEMDLTAAELPLASGGDFSLILILPGKRAEFVAGGLGQLEHKMNLENWNTLMRSLHPVNVDLKLPLFSHRSAIELNDTLAAMGVKDAFNSTADFSGINGGRDLRLSSFQQLTEFVIDEGGHAEVAAAEEEVKKRSLWRLFDFNNGRRKRGKSGRQHEQEDDDDDHDEHFYEIHFNRQFLYVVRHNPTGLLVYIGRYYQPDADHHVGHGAGHGHQHNHHSAGH